MFGLVFSIMSRWVAGGGSPVPGGSFVWGAGDYLVWGAGDNLYWGA